MKKTAVIMLHTTRTGIRVEFLQVLEEVEGQEGQVTRRAAADLQYKLQHGLCVYCSDQQ
jgi:hypothetical protein